MDMAIQLGKSGGYETVVGVHGELTDPSRSNTVKFYTVTLWIVPVIIDSHQLISALFNSSHLRSVHCLCTWQTRVIFEYLS